MTTANRVVQLRHRLGLSQEEMGKRLGVSRNYVSMVEQGREPSKGLLVLLGTLEAIADSAAQNPPNVTQQNDNVVREEMPRYPRGKLVNAGPVNNPNYEDSWERTQAQQMVGELQARALQLPKTPEANRPFIIGQMDRLYEDLKQLFSRIPYRSEKTETRE